MPPTAMQALGAGARATLRSWWLGPVALVLALLSRAAAAPAGLFLAAVGARGFSAGLAAGSGEVGAAGAALAAIGSPRALLLASGLWLAGLLLRAALRGLWLAGALPVLGEALAGRGGPAFAEGVAYRFPRVAGAALLAFLLEAAAAGCALGTLLGVAIVSGGQGPLGSAGSAAAVALALTSAAGLVLAAGVLADAAVARCALRDERPLRGFGAAALGVGRRPAAFAAVGLAVGAGALLVGGSAELAMGAALQVATARAPAALALVPQLAMGSLGAMIAALLELWRLGAVAALACHAAADRPG